MTHQWFASPVFRDMTKHPMLDFIPLAGAGWIMTHRNREPGLVSQSLQGHFPQFRSAAITAAAIRQD